MPPDPDPDPDDDEGSGSGSPPPAADTARLRQQLKEARAKLRESEARVEAAKGWESELKQLRESTEAERARAAQRSAQTEEQLTAAQSHALRLEIALEKGLPLTFAKRLQGKDRDEIVKDAEEMVQQLGQRRTVSDGGVTSGGNGPTGDSKENANDWLRTKIKDRR